LSFLEIFDEDEDYALGELVKEREYQKKFAFEVDINWYLANSPIPPMNEFIGCYKKTR